MTNLTTTNESNLTNPARTGVQLVPSAVITEFVDSFIYDFSDKQYLAFAALLLMLFSYSQAVIERKKGQELFRSS